MKNPAAGGGRWVEVPPERLVTWIVSFARRHGGSDPLSPLSSRWPSPGDDGAIVTFTAADGAVAECHVPFPPLRLPPLPAPPGEQSATEPDTRAFGEQTETQPGAQAVVEPTDTETGPDACAAAEAIAAHAGADRTVGVPDTETGPDAWTAAEAIAAHAGADRTVGVLLVRLGGYAVGVFSGSPPRLASSKTGRRLVHGRSAAGGWSQHRFARRRENQAAAALRAAADATAAIFGSYGPEGLDAVVVGGDKRSIAGLRDDARLAPYLSRATDRFLTVPDPTPGVLRDIPTAYQAIRIRLTEPEPRSPARPDQVN
jgi:Actinobacteria/chloroflexi VLRF1 release factor